MGVVACGMPMIISPTAIAEMGNEQFALNPVGTGPFKFVEREQNIKLEMERNEDYWGSKAKIERLIFQPLPDQATRLNAIRAGEVLMTTSACLIEVNHSALRTSLRRVPLKRSL
jgi:peptide/nickel transport system substrate-binding protein